MIGDALLGGNTHKIKKIKKIHNENVFSLC
jgi:hypothetical protein